MPSPLGHAPFVECCCLGSCLHLTETHAHQLANRKYGLQGIMLKDLNAMARA